SDRRGQYGQRKPGGALAGQIGQAGQRQKLIKGRRGQLGGEIHWRNGAGEIERIGGGPVWYTKIRGEEKAEDLGCRRVGGKKKREEERRRGGEGEKKRGTSRRKKRVARKEGGKERKKEKEEKEEGGREEEGEERGGGKREARKKKKKRKRKEKK
ncbi:hypothetical protein CW300_26650, partial [Serratia marcescens]